MKIVTPLGFKRRQNESSFRPSVPQTHTSPEPISQTKGQRDANNNSAAAATAELCCAGRGNFLCRRKRRLERAGAGALVLQIWLLIVINSIRPRCASAEKKYVTLGLEISPLRELNKYEEIRTELDSVLGSRGAASPSSFPHDKKCDKQIIWGSINSGISSVDIISRAHASLLSASSPSPAQYPISPVTSEDARSVPRLVAESEGQPPSLPGLAQNSFLAPSPRLTPATLNLKRISLARLSIRSIVVTACGDDEEKPAKCAVGCGWMPTYVLASPIPTLPRSFLPLGVTFAGR